MLCDHAGQRKVGTGLYLRFDHHQTWECLKRCVRDSVCYICHIAWRKLADGPPEYRAEKTANNLERDRKSSFLTATLNLAPRQRSNFRLDLKVESADSLHTLTVARFLLVGRGKPNEAVSKPEV